MTTKKKAKEEKKEEEVDSGQIQQAAAQVVQKYFTKDVNEAIQRMSNDEMFTLLRQVEATPYWTAILRYNNLRMLSAQSALNTLDPVTNPTAIGRQQGAMMGLCDLQNAIITMIEAEIAAQKEMDEMNAVGNE